VITTYDASTALEPFIEARGRFYCEIAKRVWNLDALGLAPPVAPGPAATGKRTRYGVRFHDLVEAGFISPDDRLVGHRRGQMYYARIRPDGKLETASGSITTAPTKAMADAIGVASNGWAFWKVERTRERLDVVRQRYLDHFERQDHRGITRHLLACRYVGRPAGDALSCQAAAQRAHRTVGLGVAPR
jgi:hypothetical protein